MTSHCCSTTLVGLWVHQAHERSPQIHMFQALLRSHGLAGRQRRGLVVNPSQLANWLI